MKFSDKEEQQLHRWSCIELESIGQASPAVLAKIIVASVKEDKSTAALKTHCISQLKTFLKEYTEDFVEVLFQAIEDGTYQVDIDEEANEDNEAAEDERESRGNSRRVSSSPAGSDEDDRRHRTRYRRDSSDNFEPSEPAKTSINADRYQGSSHVQSTYAHGQRQGPPPSHSQQQQPSSSAGGYPPARNAGQTGPGGYAGRFQNKHYRPEAAGRGGGTSYPGLQRTGPPQQQQFQQANDAASYNPYAGSMFPGLAVAAGFAPGGGIQQPYGWMPGQAPYGQSGHVVAPEMMYGAVPPPAAAGVGMVSTSSYPGSGVGVALKSPVKANAQIVNTADLNMHQQAPSTTLGAAAGARPPPPSGPAPPRTTSAPPPHTGTAVTGGADGAGSGAPAVDAMGAYGASVLSIPHGAYAGGGQDYGGYGASIHAPMTYPPSEGAPPFGAQQAYHHQGGGGFHHQQQQQQQQYQQHQKPHKVYYPPMPENERCTVKVTGIPERLTEADLREHFEDFGHIVAMQLTEAPQKVRPGAGGDETTTSEGDKKRVFLECLIQYHTAENAKKAYTSTRSVRDNRMIQFRAAFFNLIPPAEVEYPGDEVAARDAAIVAGTYVPPTRAPPVSRKKPFSALGGYPGGSGGGGVYQPAGVSNKYRRGADDAHYSISASTNAPQSCSEAQGTSGDSAEEGSGLGSPGPEVPPAQLTPEQTEAKQKFEQLKQLRVQAEEIARKKEAILQASVEKCRAMIDKLEQAEDSDSKATTLHTLEAKMLALQTQLRTLRGQAAERSAAASEGQQQQQQYHQQQQNAYPARGGYPYSGGRGRGGYGHFYPPTGRGYYNTYPPAAGRGRGRGRGRGAYFSNQAYVAPSASSGSCSGGSSAESYEEGGGVGDGEGDGGGSGDGYREQWQTSEGHESAEMEG